MSGLFRVNEVYFTFQTEGFHAGQVAVFCRFSKCNFWNGKESTRANAVCDFCDTDFVGFAEISIAQLVLECLELWNKNTSNAKRPFVVLTGGEPMLQVTSALVDALHDAGFYVAIETNGSIACDVGIDWICVSPKSLDRFSQTTGNEMKFVYPQANLDPLELDISGFEHLFIQPKHSSDYEANLRSSMEFCARHPSWRLSLQSHKWIEGMK